jgi:hypothetical protein
MLDINKLIFYNLMKMVPLKLNKLILIPYHMHKVSGIIFQLYIKNTYSHYKIYPITMINVVKIKEEY